MDLLGRKRSAKASHAPGPPAPFVVGAARSGTTMLRLMLDAHRELAIPPETQVVPEMISVSKEEGAGASEVAELLVTHRRFPDFDISAEDVRDRFSAIQPWDVGEAIREFFRLYAEKEGKPRWGDKTPGYSRYIKRIHKHLPEARFIHLIRDGRDVRLSQLGRGSDHPTPERHGRRWCKRVLAAREQGSEVPHYIEVRYEDLVLDTEPALKCLCGFLELDWDPGMLRFHERAHDRLSEIARDLPEGEELAEGRHRSHRTAEDRLHLHRLTSEPPRKDRVARWRSEMTVEDRAGFESEAGELLAELGYEVGNTEVVAQEA
jgi:Sulfotransferase family